MDMKNAVFTYLIEKGEIRTDTAEARLKRLRGEPIHE